MAGMNDPVASPLPTRPSVSSLRHARPISLLFLRFQYDSAAGLLSSRLLHHQVIHTPQVGLPALPFDPFVMNADHTILLVDDNPTFLQHAARFIERNPRLLVAGTAHCIADGLTAAERLRPDIILLDLSMPDRSGLEAISDFHAAVPNARIIVLTMQDAETYRDVALHRGADGFVSKNDMASDLVEAMLHPPTDC